MEKLNIESLDIDALEKMEMDSYDIETLKTLEKYIMKRMKKSVVWMTILVVAIMTLMSVCVENELQLTMFVLGFSLCIMIPVSIVVLKIAMIVGIINRRYRYWLVRCGIKEIQQERKRNK